MRPSAPTLLLDFDGVLHPDCVYRVQGRIVLKRDGIGLFEWSPILLPATLISGLHGERLKTSCASGCNGW